MDDTLQAGAEERRERALRKRVEGLIREWSVRSPQEIAPDIIAAVRAHDARRAPAARPVMARVEHITQIDNQWEVLYSVMVADGAASQGVRRELYTGRGRTIDEALRAARAAAGETTE